MRSIQLAIAALAFFAAAPASAGPAADSLIACLADNTSGKERKELARWLFASMAAHPEMRDIASATTVVREQTSQSAGLLFTRLLSENCPTQYRVALRTEGSPALVAAFESLGRLAMQELMTNDDVRTAIGNLEKFVDRRKLEAALLKE